VQYSWSVLSLWSLPESILTHPNGFDSTLHTSSSRVGTAGAAAPTAGRLDCDADASGATLHDITGPDWTEHIAASALGAIESRRAAPIASEAARNVANKMFKGAFKR
jgi:hypothetical protein